MGGGGGGVLLSQIHQSTVEYPLWGGGGGCCCAESPEAHWLRMQKLVYEWPLLQFEMLTVVTVDSSLHFTQRISKVCM